MRHKRLRLDPWVRNISQRRAWQPTPVFLPGESPGRGVWKAIVRRITKIWTQLEIEATQQAHRSIDWLPCWLRWKRIFIPMQETSFRSLGQEESLEKVMVTHSSVLAMENSTDRGVWWATVHGVPKSQTRLSDKHFDFHKYRKDI